jgi:glyoxylase-like metal-dependent hydrolase (beta-lactamase superfamily II)
VAYVINGQNDVFVGDAVQVHGAANGFPGFVDPAGYRASLRYLRDEIRPRHLYLGHPYRRADGTPYGVELDAGQAEEALKGSLEIEARVNSAAHDCLAAGLQDSGSPYSPFARVAEDLGYEGDPALEPSPFFTTLNGYRTTFDHMTDDEETNTHG